MPATRKTRQQQKAAKEESKETVEDQPRQEEEEEDAKRPRRGRPTRAAQKANSKKKNNNDDPDEEENESSKEGDDVSEDRTRTRRKRRGKTEKEVVAAETNEKDEDEAETKENTNKTEKRVSKQRNAPARRSKTPTNSSSEPESVDPPPRKTRASLAGARKRKASEDESLSSDSADKEKEGDDKSEKSESESENETSTRVTRASRSKARKSNVSQEVAAVNDEQAKEGDEQKDEMAERSESESENENSSRIARASRFKTRKSHEPKEEIAPSDENDKEVDEEETDEPASVEAPGERELENEKDEQSRAATGERPSKGEAVTHDATSAEEESDEKEKKADDKTEESGSESENQSSSRVTRASKSKARKSHVPKDEVTPSDETVKVFADQQTVKPTGGKAPDESEPEKEKGEQSRAVTAIQPKAKGGIPKRKSNAKKQQEEEAINKQKNSKQLKLSEFLKPKEDVDAGKQDNEGPRKEPNDNKSNKLQRLDDSEEDAQEDDARPEPETKPDDKAHQKQIEESSIEMETDSSDDREKEISCQIAAVREVQEASTSLEKDQPDEPGIKDTITVSDEKNQTGETDAEETTIKSDETNEDLEAITATSDRKKEADELDGEAHDLKDVTDQASNADATEAAPTTKDIDKSDMMDVEGTTASLVRNDEAVETVTELTKEDEGGSLQTSSEQLLIDEDKNSEKSVTIRNDGLEHDDGDLNRLRTDQVGESVCTGVVKEPFGAKLQSQNEKSLPCAEDTTGGEAMSAAEDENIVVCDDDMDVRSRTNDVGEKDDVMENTQFDMKQYLFNEVPTRRIEKDAFCEPANDSIIDPQPSESICVAESNKNSVNVLQSRSSEIDTNPGILATGDTSRNMMEGSQEEPRKASNVQSSIEEVAVVEHNDKESTSAVASSDQSSATIHIGISGPAQTDSVSVEIAPELVIPSIDSSTQLNATRAQDNYAETDHEEDFQLRTSDSADGSENKKRPMDDDDEVDGVVLKRRKVDDQDSVDLEAEEPKKYINLKSLKMRLFATGSRVHGRVGYEKLFREYWNSIALYLDSRLPMSYSKVCKKIIDRFLRTKSLRQLHNRLIMDLIDRSSDEKIPAHLVDLQSVPDDVRARIRPAACRRAQTRDVLTSNVKKLETEFRSALSMHISPTKHAPLMSVPSKLHISSQNTIRKSASIPGALIVDPYMRKNAQSLGMMVSENAIWLITIAMKEYTSQLLRNLVGSSKLLHQGQVPPTSANRLTPPKKKGQETAKVEDRPLPYDNSRGVQSLSAFDIHLFTAGMPIGYVGAMGGYSSRLTYERSLATCVGEVFNLSAFDDLKHFITSSLEATIVAPKVSDRRSPASVSPSSDRRSPYGGLGRGAKDLAALKARASQKIQPQPHANQALPQNSETQVHQPQQQEQTGHKFAAQQQQQQVAMPQQHQKHPAAQRQKSIDNQQQQATTEQQQPYTAQQLQLQRQMMQQTLQQSQQHALAQPQQYLPSEGSQEGKGNVAKSSTPPKHTQQMQSSPPQQPQPSQLVRQSSLQMQPQLMPQPSQLNRQSSQQLQSSPPKLQSQPSQLMRQSSQNVLIQGQPMMSPQPFPQPAIQGQPLSPIQQQQMQMQLQMMQQQMQQRDPQLAGQMNAQAQVPPSQLQQQQMQMQIQQQMMQMQYMQAMQAQVQKQLPSPSNPTQPSTIPQVLSQPATLQQPSNVPPPQPPAPQTSPQPPQQAARPPSATGGKGFGIKNLKAMLARSAPTNEETGSTAKENPATTEASSKAAAPEDASNPPTRNDEDPKPM